MKEWWVILLLILLLKAIKKLGVVNKLMYIKKLGAKINGHVKTLLISILELNIELMNFTMLILDFDCGF